MMPSPDGPFSSTCFRPMHVRNEAVYRGQNFPSHAPVIAIKGTVFVLVIMSMGSRPLGIRVFETHKCMY
jgi:hypothetical protein